MRNKPLISPLRHLWFLLSFLLYVLVGGLGDPPRPSEQSGGSVIRVPFLWNPVISVVIPLSVVLMASRFVALSTTLVCLLSEHEGEITHVGRLSILPMRRRHRHNTATLSPHAFFLSNNLLPWSEGDVRQIVDLFPSRHSVTGTTKPSFFLSDCYVL